MSADTPTTNQPSPNTSTPKKGNGAKIAAIILAITTVIGLVWGGVMTSKYNSEKDAHTSANSQIADDGSQIAGDEAEIKADKETLAKVRQELGIDDKQIAQDAKNLAAEVAIANQLKAKYDQAQKTDNSLQGQVMAANAKADLASQCAAILAAGYEVLYKDVATGVTYKEIAAQIKAAAQPCKGVINFQPLNR